MNNSPSYLRASLKTDKQVIYVDMDGVLCDFDKRHEELMSKGINQFQAFNHAFAFKDLDPMPGAIEAWQSLQEKYDTYILSTAMWSNTYAWTDKRIWVQKYLGKSANKKLILSHNKGLLRGDFLIDDRIANGVADFEGEHIHFGTEKFPTWKQVLDYLLTTEEKENEENQNDDMAQNKALSK
jgi:5'(3')-deoxyribonucleotidase